MPSDLAFVLLLVRCAVAALFLMLGTVSTVLWRQQLAAAPPAAPAPASGAAWMLPMLGVLFYTIGLLLAVWAPR